MNIIKVDYLKKFWVSILKRTGTFGSWNWNEPSIFTNKLTNIKVEVSKCVKPIRTIESKLRLTRVKSGNFVNISYFCPRYTTFWTFWHHIYSFSLIILKFLSVISLRAICIYKQLNNSNQINKLSQFSFNSEKMTVKYQMVLKKCK